MLVLWALWFPWYVDVLPDSHAIESDPCDDFAGLRDVFADLRDVFADLCDVFPGARTTRYPQ